MKRIILLCLALGLALPVFANSPEPEEGAASKTIYYGLVPALVGNYGSDGKLKYYKADIALRVTGSEAEAKV